jgi:hypothetical protein
MITALKSTPQGDWLLTLKVDADCDDAPKLAKAHGLALKIDITRLIREVDESQ